MVLWVRVSGLTSPCLLPWIVVACWHLLSSTLSPASLQSLHLSHSWWVP